ncbi:MAG TPA: hypothetical protein VMF50_04180, partial [Candidatus Binataceae bacterium]|nr:hypothetical protein [Candidatus Binataceae bacterium]
AQASIKWADSNDPDDREFAAWIFSDIATPEAINRRQSLSHDSAVGDTAKILLKPVKQGSVVHQVDEDFVPAKAVTANH